MFEHLMNDHGEWNQVLAIVGDWPLIRAYLATLPSRTRAVIGRLRRAAPSKAPKQTLDES